MDRASSRNDVFEAVLTASSFLAMVLTGIFAFLDALGGSRWFTYEFALACACGASFVTLVLPLDVS